MTDLVKVGKCAVFSRRHTKDKKCFKLVCMLFLSSPKTNKKDWRLYVENLIVCDTNWYKGCILKEHIQMYDTLIMCTEILQNRCITTGEIYDVG